MKIRNPLAQQSLEEKRAQYNKDCETSTIAYKEDRHSVPLSSVNFDDVEFISGFWRVQNKFNYKIQKVRDRKMVIGSLIQHNERTCFDYYNAAFVTYNCYGPLPPRFDMVVARFVTSKGKELLAYGKTIADARAFLGILLCDALDFIHANKVKNVQGKVK